MLEPAFQIFGQRGGRGITRGRFFRQTFQTDRLQVARNVLIRQAGGLR